LNSDNKNNFRLPHNLNSINLPIRAADLEVKIVLESRNVNWARFGFTGGTFCLPREKQNTSFGAKYLSSLSLILNRSTMVDSYLNS
jgi:hypothetical protein